MFGNPFHKGHAELCPSTWEVVKHMNYNPNSLKGIIWGIIQGTTIGVLMGHARSLDYSSYGPLFGCRIYWGPSYRRDPKTEHNVGNLPHRGKDGKEVPALVASFIFKVGAHTSYNLKLLKRGVVWVII